MTGDRTSGDVPTLTEGGGWVTWRVSAWCVCVFALCVCFSVCVFQCVSERYTDHEPLDRGVFTPTTDIA